MIYGFKWKKNMGERFLQKTGTSNPPLYLRVPLAIVVNTSDL
jgi:hypothetical protein